MVDKEKYYDQEEMETQGNEVRKIQEERFNEVNEILNDIETKSVEEKMGILKEATEYLEQINGDLVENYDEIIKVYDILEEFVKKHEEQLQNAGIDYSEEHEGELKGINTSSDLYYALKTSAQKRMNEVKEEYFAQYEETQEVSSVDEIEER